MSTCVVSTVIGKVDETQLAQAYTWVLESAAREHILVKDTGSCVDNGSRVLTEYRPVQDAGSGPDYWNNMIHALAKYIVDGEPSFDSGTLSHQHRPALNALITDSNVS